MLKQTHYLFHGFRKFCGISAVRVVGLCLVLLCVMPNIMLAESHVLVNNQQESTVKGVVTDNNGEALVGAYVVIKGTTTGVSTDVDGKFEIKTKIGTPLEISYFGYKTVTIAATSAPMNISLEEDALGLDEVIVVGYGTTSKRDLISSVSTVKTEEIANVPVANILQGLAGRSPGMIVRSSGGGLYSNTNISIRGGGTPLYVIDGIIRDQTDFANLTADDIESMSILKDASATAVYGSRATNGIVQITTKKGKSGKANVEYDFNYSIAQPNIWPKQLDSYTRAEYGNIARTNDGLDPVYSEDAIKAMREGTDPLTFGNTNWRELVLNNWAPQTKNTIKITGGGETSKYYASLSHIDQNSLYKTNTHWMKRTNFRIAQTTTLKEIGLEINTSIDGYWEKKTHPYSSTSSGYYQVFSHINDKSPLSPGVNKYGLPYLLNDNPVAETAEDNGYIKNRDNVINGKGELIWSLPWVDGLKLRAASNYRYYSGFTKSWRKDPAQYSWDSTEPQYANKPQLEYRNWTGSSFTNQIFAEYGNTFGKHTVSALAGFEQYYEKGDNYWLSRRNYDFTIDQISVGPADTKDNGGSEAELGRAAVIGQLKYNYDNKYYAEGSIRYDGSDRFAPGKRWGTFFSGSIGWVVTQEEFMQSLVDRDILNSLKIRASYGETGLDESAGRFAYLTSYGLNTQSYVVDGKYVPGFSEGGLPSPDLTWYTTKQFDVGFDFSSLNHRLYGSFDYFYYTTKGYLVAPTGESYLNTVIGVSMPRVKSDSEHRRAGIELQLGYRGTIGELRYDVSGNFTYFDQLMAYDESEAESSYMNPYTRQQQQKGYYGTMLHNLGYYTSADDVYNSPSVINSMNSGYLTAGDIKYEDTNGDGRIDGNDNRRLGRNSAPRGQFGITLNLNYRGFYFSTLFQGSTSFDMYIGGSAAMQTGQAGAMPVIFGYQKDFWTTSNRGAQYPRLMSNTGLNANNNYTSSDFWLVDGAYVRMKDFQFGYDLKHSVLKNINWLSKVRVGISGQNLFTISKITKYGLDPENSSTVNYGYPVSRTLAFTLNLGF